MSTLILTLPTAPDGPATKYVYTLTADGHTALSHARAPAKGLPEPSRPGGEVVAVVPARALSWQRVQLPAGVPVGNGAHTPRLRSVLEGLLEERVLDDASELHFALEPQASADAPLWVAVCDRAWLRGHLQALEAAGRRVARVVPEFAPGATASGLPELTAMGTPEDAWVMVTGQGNDQAATLLPMSAMAMSLAAASLPPSHPEDKIEVSLTVQAEPAVAALAECVLGQRATLQTSSDRAMVSARSDWDLAQFDLASNGRTRALRKAGGLLSAWLYAPRWRAARWGTAVLVVAQVAGLNAWAWQERKALEAKQQAVRTALTDTFPQVRVVVDAPVQMERELALMRQDGGGVSPRDLEPLLAATGAALPAGTLPTAVEFTPGELRLRGLNLPLEAKSALSDRLQASGLRALWDDSALVVRAVSAP